MHVGRHTSSCCSDAVGVLKVLMKFTFVCQDSASSIDAENLIMSMPGNGSVQPQKQQLLPDPLRPGSGQVTPVFGKAFGVHHVVNVSICVWSNYRVISWMLYTF